LSAEAPADGPHIVGLAPDVDVAPTAAVELHLSAAVRAPSRAPRVTAIRRELSSSEAPIEVHVTLAADGLSLLVRPASAWPLSATIGLRLDSALVGLDGRPMLAPRWHEFVTRAAPLVAPAIVVRAPSVDQVTPVNLRWLAATISPPQSAWSVRLVSSAHFVDAVSVHVSAGGRMLVGLPRLAGTCTPLCPNTEYDVVVEGELGTVIAPDRLRTGTVADERAPNVRLSTLVEGDHVELLVDADEPVVASGALVDAAGNAFDFVTEATTAGRARLASIALPAERDLQVRVVVKDLAGNEVVLEPTWLRTPPRVHAVLSELVATPLRDWSDSVPAGAPFDDRWGSGAVTDADEWIELVNTGTVPIDLAQAGLRVLTLDGTPRETRLATAAKLWFGSGGAADRWRPREALVFRPHGTMRSDEIVLELYAGRTLLDRWVIGDELDADHRGASPPDLEHEAIARTPDGRLRWCVPSPGDPAAPLDCRD